MRTDAAENRRSQRTTREARHLGVRRPAEELRLMNAWWHAWNYLSVGMIYLRDNPLLKKPLKVEHVKHRLLGHWGASPALSFVWAHLDRVTGRDDGNGGLDRLAACYLDSLATLQRPSIGLRHPLCVR